jgi:predicted kinase
MSIQHFHDAMINLQPINLVNFLSVIPELHLMADCRQSEKHHAEGSVLVHANMALQQVLPLLDQVDNNDDKVILYIATMLHDIGKPTTFAISSKHGRITAYGHDKAGVPIANEFLKKYFLEFKYPTREKILRLIEYHMQPRQMMKDGTTDQKLKIMSLAVNTKLLYLLSTADTLGRIADDMSGCELLEKFKQECGRLDIFDKPYVIPNSHWMTGHGYSQARWDILVNNAPETDETLEKAEDLIMKAVPRFQLLLLVGAPASGKSTYLTQLKQQCPDVTVISMDERRRELTGDINNQSCNQEVFSWQQKTLHKAMRNKQNTVIDATNCTRKLRKMLLQEARRYGAVVGAVYFDIAYQTLLDRNAGREKKVPEDVVRRFYKTQESLLPHEVDGLRIIDS